MSRIFKDLKIGLSQDLRSELSKELQRPDFDLRILRKSIDARSKTKPPHYVYTVEVFFPGETPAPRVAQAPKVNSWTLPPVAVVGMGPAGLFAALRLLERGVPVHLFERGDLAENRIHLINRFWRYGELHPHNNVGFGEGGAGMYSDGKLITRIKSEHIPYVMQRFVDAGGPEEITYLANPHLGSDRIRRLLPALRKMLIGLGAQLHYNSPITDILVSGNEVTGVQTADSHYECSAVVLATGHSATDIFEILAQKSIFMEPKDFAMGLRIEHDQSFINKTQYRAAWEFKELGAANYKLTHHDHNSNIGVYTFCMCPGGYALSATTETGTTVSNGMSNYNRNSPFANSAVVVTTPVSNKNLWSGIHMRKELETRAYSFVNGSQKLPAQKLEDFLLNRNSVLRETQVLGGVQSARLDQLLEGSMRDSLMVGLKKFAEKMPGFVHERAHLYGVETRTSCPLRITRNDSSLMSLSHSRLYPCGEGAGYAGGITSAACDGVRIADQICSTNA